MIWYRRIKLVIDHIIHQAKLLATGQIETHAVIKEGQDIHTLARRCPACFYRLTKDSAASVTSEALPLDLIVCLDGNFQHKRRNRVDGSTDDLQERQIILSREKVQSMEEHVNIKRGYRSESEPGCLSHFKAANESASKASSVVFDITGLMLLTCCHDIPLFACDIYTPGEKQFYALALLKSLFDAVGEKVRKIGVLYDIACTLEKSIQIHNLVPEFANKMHWATSIFHSYGHDLPCQMQFSPRLCHGFGLSDGEGNERLWSALANTIAKERSMGLAVRHVALESRLHRIGHDKVCLMANYLNDKIRALQKKQHKALNWIDKGTNLIQETCITDLVTISAETPLALAILPNGKKIFELLSWRELIERRPSQNMHDPESILNRVFDLEKQLETCKEQIQEVDAIGTALANCDNFMENESELRRATEVYKRLESSWTVLHAALTQAQCELHPSALDGPYASRIGLVQLSLLASKLATILSSYHMDNARIHGGAHYPAGTKAHQTTVTGMQRHSQSARKLLNRYNTRVASWKAVQLSRTDIFEIILPHELFLKSTLQKLHYLSVAFGHSNTPWRYNPQLQSTLDEAAILL